MDAHAASSRQSITDLLAGTLDRLAAAPTLRPGETATTEAPATESTLGALLDALDERAFGLMLLILALPCCLPFLYGIPQIVALPMLALCAQLAMGRHDPWFPQKLQDRSFEIERMRGVVARAKRYLGWAEALAKPRLTFITQGRMAQIVGALLLIPCASILVPAPMTNTPPGIGVAIAAVGLIERDGVLVVLGLLFGMGWVIMLITMILVFGPEGIDIAKDFIKGLLGSS